MYAGGGLEYLEIPVESLTLGMYVAELDRPWLDTPFLLQGFVLDDVSQLEVLRKYCRYVLVDRTRSLPEAQSALPAPVRQGHETENEQVRVRRIRVHAEPTQSTAAAESPAHRNMGAAAAPATSAPHTPNSAGKPVSRAPQPKVVVYGNTVSQSSAATALHFNNLLQLAERQEVAIHESLAARFLGAIGSFLGSPFRRKQKNKPLSALLEAGIDTSPNNPIAPGIELTIYETKRTVEEELPAARSAFQKATHVLDKLVSDIRAGIQLNVADFDEAVSDMVDSVLANPDALMWVARLRQADATTYGHGLKVAVYLIGMGRQIGLPREHLTQLGLVGMLLDVGKLKVPRNLLQRAGTLSDEEFMTVQQHVERGLEMLRESQSVSEAVSIGIAQHHERLDGSGYPHKLTQDEISLYGRMAGIVDTFAAMTSPRPYAEPHSPYEALAHLFEWSGRLFHEPLVEKFVQAVGIYPVGSLIELSTGEVAIVLAHNRIRRLQPRVLVLTGPDKVSLKFPTERNLLYQTETLEGQPIRIARGLPAGSYNLDVRDHYQARTPV